MIATYHNHSTWSDGTSSVAALVEWARHHDVDELGVSDHLTLRPNGDVPKWSMAPSQLDAYVRDVRAHGDTDTPVVRLGVEVDWYPGHADVIRSTLEGRPWDYLIGSVHEIGDFILDGSPASWERLDTAERDAMHRAYWINIRSLAESGLFDIVGHLDLSKKFGFRPTTDLSAEIDAALDAIAEAELIVELNTAGWHKPCDEAYPSLELLGACRQRAIDVTLSADAHQPEQLLRDFIRGTAVLAETGFTRVARFSQRTVTFEPIEATERPANTASSSGVS